MFLLLLITCIAKASLQLPAQPQISEHGDHKSNLTILASTKTEKQAKSSALSINKDDMVLGNTRSSLVFIEYFSPTCFGCAYYNKIIFPEIKKRYIDTNKIAYVTRELIGNKQDLAAAILARCQGDNNNFFKYVAIILEQQERWSLSRKYRKILTDIGQLNGLTPEKYQECLHDTKLIEVLIINTKAATKSPQFFGTPAFFINGKQFLGDYSLEEISEAIDQELQQLNNS